MNCQLNTNCHYKNCVKQAVCEMGYCELHFFRMYCIDCYGNPGLEEGGRCEECQIEHELAEKEKEKKEVEAEAIDKDSQDYTDLAEKLDGELTDWRSAKERLMKTLSGCDKTHVAVIKKMLTEIITKTKRKRDEVIQSTKKQRLEEVVNGKKKSIEVTNVQNTDACSICKDTTRDCATGCGHLFCHECITGWLKVKNECPICKTTHPFVIKFSQ